MAYKDETLTSEIKTLTSEVFQTSKVLTLNSKVDPKSLELTKEND